MHIDIEQLKQWIEAAKAAAEALVAIVTVAKALKAVLRRHAGTSRGKRRRTRNRRHR